MARISNRERGKDIVLQALLSTYPIPWRVRMNCGQIEIVAHGGGVVGTWACDDLDTANEIAAEANKLSI
jgi:hypothetical protein